MEESINHVNYFKKKEQPIEEVVEEVKEEKVVEKPTSRVSRRKKK